jgi:D-glycero-D-manno-heptose 1,7-bisphosphate phosphatase
VRWCGPGAPAELGAEPAPPGARADLVLGGGRPAAVAWLGWRAGVHGMLLSLAPDAPERWSFVDRWCWDSVDSWGIEAPAPLQPEAAAAARIDHERVVFWPEAPAAERVDATHPDTETLERACERLIARRRGAASHPAAFLDRDGTLVVERGYAADGAAMELLPGVPGALRSLTAAGYVLVVVSNQAGVGRGLFTLEAVFDTMRSLRLALRRHGVELDAIYFCPHRPDEGCDCRKPAPGLLRRAAQDLRLSLKDSLMVGDKLIDVEAGHAAGARGALVRTGYGREEERNLGGWGGRAPDRVGEDLAEVARWAVEHDR